jgi:hypothetical protein
MANKWSKLGCWLKVNAPLNHPLKAVNPRSERPTEALLAVGSVVAILALLLVLSGGDVSDDNTSASAPSTETDTVASNEN